MIYRLFSTAIAGFCLATTVHAQQTQPVPPAYHVAESIKPPAGFVQPASNGDLKGYFEAVDMNAQKFVLFDYDANQSDRNAPRTPVVWRGRNLPFITLTNPPRGTSVRGQRVFAKAISDVAPDGSFWVAAEYWEPQTPTTFAKYRAMAWHVQADGSNVGYLGRNLPSLQDGTEDSDARVYDINSSGVAVGFGKQTSPLGNVARQVAVRWVFPNGQAESLDSPNPSLYIARAVNEAGTFVAEGTSGDGRTAAYYNYTPFPIRGPAGGGGIGLINLRGNVATGRYQFSDPAGEGAYLYKLGDAGVTRLPVLSENGKPLYGGASAIDVNAAGDAVGYTRSPAGSSGNVLWKKQSDGTYAVYSVTTLLNQTDDSRSFTDGRGIRAIAEDGTILFTLDREGGVLLSPGVDPRPSISSPRFLKVGAGQPFSFQVTATNRPTQFRSPRLPEGTQLDPNTGVFSGVIGTPGAYSATFEALNELGVGARQGHLTIFAVNASTAPTVTITSPADGQTFTAGQAITLSANAAQSSPFFLGAVHLSDNGAPVAYRVASTTLTGLVPGLHVLSVSVGNGAGQQTTQSVTIRVLPAAGQAYTFSGSGDWFDPSRWTPNGVPGPNDVAFVNQSNVSLSQAVTIGGLSLNGGTISGPGSLTVLKSFVIAAGTLNDVPVNIAASAELSFEATGEISMNGGQLTNRGSVRVGRSTLLNAVRSLALNFGTLVLTSQEARAAFAQVKNNGGFVQLNTGRLTVSDGFVQHGGTLSLGSDLLAFGSRGVIEGNVTIEDGALTGIGRIVGSLTSVRGAISPGNSPGLIEVTGNYTQGEGATLVMEAEGSAAHEYDRLAIGGTASLAGKLIVRSGGLGRAQAIEMLTYGNRTGTFDSVSSNVELYLQPNDLDVAIISPNGPATKALNISTRMRVETGDNVLIAGFIITGDKPKKVLIRGLGPSLPVSSALADPVLDLDNGIVINDDWKSSQQSEIAATTIPPSNDVESAIVATLQPGGHTAILRGKNNATGVGLVEVYDLESGAPEQLANISTRGLVQTGDNVMIGGFIIAGDYPAKVVLRAIGPSLTTTGVSGALQDPVLELVDSNGNSISNDDWRATQQSELFASSVAPSNDKESAIVATLPPGFYTAIVRGKDGTTGVALVEGYNLQ